MISNSFIETKPSTKQLMEIHSWLKKEYDKTHQGFYCNWSIIVQAFEKEKLIIFQSSNKTIGFVVWRAMLVHVEIDIMEILLVFGINNSFSINFSL